MQAQYQLQEMMGACILPQLVYKNIGDGTAIFGVAGGSPNF